MKKRFFVVFFATSFAFIFCLGITFLFLFNISLHNDDLPEEKIDTNSNISQEITNPVDNDKKIKDEISVIFNPDADEMFVFENAESRHEFENYIGLRSEYSTSLAGSDKNRKHNVETAIKCFNGLIVLPDEEISFNKTTGERTNNSDYKPAKIIVQGEFVVGTGGGVCQASTTLYNALIRSDLEILEVHNHSLPVGYVPLGFDAMVNDSTSDLVFKNTTGFPLYFCTGLKDEKVFVKIFGLPLEKGLSIETRSELVKELPHKGDKIIPDTQGKYSDKITFKGEYLRVRYPQKGSEYLGFIQYKKDGKLQSEKQVRHSYYSGQEGIIMEGTEDLYEGMTLPENKVKFINSEVWLLK